MISSEAKKLIEKIRKDLADNGLVADAIAADLRVLRPYALEEKDPLVTKVIRMTYEHLEEVGTYDIDQPEEQLDEDEEPIEPVGEIEDEKSENWREESLDFLLALLANSENKINRPDISAYKFAYLAYAEAQ